VAVHDSRAGMALAWADVDVLEFGMGASTINMDTLALVPNPAVPQSAYRVRAGVKMHAHMVRVCLCFRTLICVHMCTPRCTCTPARNSRCV